MNAAPIRVMSRFDDPDYKYRVYLVVTEFLEDYKPLENLIQLLINFNKLVGDKVSVTIPFPGSYRVNRLYVLGRDWDFETQKELQQATYPFLVITRKQMSSFSPEVHEHIIIKFPEAIGGAEQYLRLFDEIATEILSNRDIFDWRREHAKKEAKGELLSRLVEAIEAKPGALGFFIDLKKLLFDI